MPEQTFAEAFEELKQAVYASGEKSAPLLALVREKRKGYDGAVGHNWYVPIPDSYVSRHAYWEAADNGAWEGALLKAAGHLDPSFELFHRLQDLASSPGDTRIPATQAMTAWVKEQCPPLASMFTA